MRGLTIMRVFIVCSCYLTAGNNNSSSKNSEIPYMQTGHSLVLNNSHLLQEASRRLVLSRFAENLKQENRNNEREIPRILEQITGNPGIINEIAETGDENADSHFETIQRSLANLIKQRLPLTLKNSPEDCIITAGFKKEPQDKFTEAGCYIRLGQSLKSSPLTRNLASNAFLKAGTLYASSQDDSNNKIDRLLSSAKCYYWAYCNEYDYSRKPFLKKLSTDYLNYALIDAQPLNNEEIIIRIQTEKEKLA